MSNISQTSQPNPYSNRFIPVEQGSDFFENLQRCRDDGEKRRLFMETAARQDVPLRAIGEILTYRDQLLVTLALQSLSGIQNQEIRHKLVNLELIEGVDPSPEELYALPNPEEYQPWSVLVLHKLCEQAESGSSDLARMSAAWTIEQLGYSPAYTGKLLHQDANKIWDKIFVDATNNRRYSDDRIKYQEYLDFWTFAPINILQWVFRSRNSDLINSVLARLGVLGIQLILGGLHSLDIQVLTSALTLADHIVLDQKYSDDQTQYFLANILVPVLQDSRLELVYMAANTLSKQLKYLSNSEQKIVNFILFKTPQPPSKFTGFTQQEFDQRIQEYKELRDLYQAMFEEAVQESKNVERLGNIEPVIEEIAKLRHSEIVTFVLFSTPPLVADQNDFTEQDFNKAILDCQNTLNVYKNLYKELIEYYRFHLIFENIIKAIEELLSLIEREFQNIQDELSTNLEKLKEVQKSIQYNMDHVGHIHSKYLVYVLKLEKTREPWGSDKILDISWWDEFDKEKCSRIISQYKDFAESVETYNECMSASEAFNNQVVLPLFNIFKNNDKLKRLQDENIDKSKQVFSVWSPWGCLFYIGLMLFFIPLFFGESAVAISLIGILVISFVFIPISLFRNKADYLAKVAYKLKCANEYLKDNRKYISNSRLSSEGKKLTQSSFRFVERMHEKLRQN
ncbi:MAG: hypothetical protein ACO31I_06725 [Prochlorotrichaceae cyanobacterium]|jgi:hypothetical protein